MTKETGRDCIVCVRSEQRNVDGERQIIETKSRGRLSEMGEVLYVLYRESPDEVQAGASADVKNLLKVERRSARVELKKSGAVSWKMCFEQGKRVSAQYGTPYGFLEICVETKAVTVKTGQEKTSLQLIYTLFIQGEKQADCRLEIEIF